MIEVTVKTLDSQNHQFSVDDEITVKEFKEHISEKVNISADIQRLIYCGRVLQDAKKLNEYDVNGKVIHLVQRLPPQPGNSGTHSSSSSTNSSPRFTTRHVLNSGPGNPIYLGSMAYSTDVMDSQQGIPQLPPSQNISNSRLAVARRMLRIASNRLSLMESNASESSGPAADENGSPVDELNETTPVLAAQVIVPANMPDQQHESMTAAAIQAALAATNNFRNVSGATEQQQAPVADTEASAGAEPQAANGDTTPPQSMTPTIRMSELLDELSRVNARLSPFLQRYHELMREDPTFPSEEESRQAQLLFDRVSCVLHALSHAYHALSDIICPLRNQPAPRSLLCRPILVQHAVLQAGISLPVQVEVLQAHVDITSHGNSPPESNATANTTSAATPTPPGATAEPQANNETAPQAPRPAETQQQQQAPPRGRQPQVTVTNLPGGGRNVDIFVAMGSDNSSNEGANPLESFMAGAGMGSLPNHEMINSLVSAVTNSMIRGVTLGTGGIPIGANITVSTSGSNSSSANEGRGSATTPGATTPPTATTAEETAASVNQSQQPGQNSQARGNTATLPTTSTQTPRATPRPHVHLAPHAFRGFDPFLQCNSHHVSGRSARQSNRGHVRSGQINIRQNRGFPRDVRGETVGATAPPANADTERAVPEGPAPQSNVTINNSSAVAEPMEIDTFYDAADQSITSTSEAHRSPQRVLLPTSSNNVQPEVQQPLPDVTIGSEPWHNNVPPNWVSIVTRDIQTQRQQGPQPPFSDAYMSGVPAKRRKIIACNKPQGSLQQIISDGLRQAVLNSGLSSSVPVESIVRAAATDASLQTAYREELRQSVAARPAQANAPDLAPVERFPNAYKSGFFDKA